MNWNDHKLERYCRFVLGRPVRAFRVQTLPTEAAVHPCYPILFYGHSEIPRSIIWHECGHLRRHEQTGRLESVTRAGKSVVKDAFTTDEVAILLKETCSNCQNCQSDDLVQEEREAHRWAILEARKRGYLDLEAELLADLMTWNDFKSFQQHNFEAFFPRYQQAQQLILQDLQIKL